MGRLQLPDIRKTLIRLEESILFSLIERAQFAENRKVYETDAFVLPDYKGSFLAYLLHQQEAIYARVCRYHAPDEVPFTENLPDPVIGLVEYEWPILHNRINMNDRIWRVYIGEIVPLICAPGDDCQYGSTAVCDVIALQSLSRRIHFGKFVAEAKYIENNELFRSTDPDDPDEKYLWNCITDTEVENRLYHRIHLKAQTYGTDPTGEISGYAPKITPETAVRIYREYIIPLTKKVEIQYLRLRIKTDMGRSPGNHEMS